MKNHPYLITRSLMPENQESPIHFLEKWLIKNKYFYRRNHFLYPEIDFSQYALFIDGRIETPLIYTYDDILNMPAKTITMVLECSGNKRAKFEPKVFGEQWEDGAINHGVWKGVPLRKLLAKSRIYRDIKEVVFEGYDYGKHFSTEEVVPFARSLPMEKALHPDTIIAYEYNGQPISNKHGFPLRLIVPEWYGMASVKWLRRISLITEHFQGPFQAVDYNYYPNKENDLGKEPVTLVNVNSIIQKPVPYQILDEGTHTIEGIAWTGTGKIEEVEVSIDGGLSWQTATLYQDQNQPYSWTRWEYEWKVNKEGEYQIFSRAKDSAGRVQPMEPFWNRKGYGYNAVYKIKVKVE